MLPECASPFTREAFPTGPAAHQQREKVTSIVLPHETPHDSRHMS
jgi:hypothetical protein